LRLRLVVERLYEARWFMKVPIWLGYAITVPDRQH
jgi:hypothetical protein